MRYDGCDQSVVKAEDFSWVYVPVYTVQCHTTVYIIFSDNSPGSLYCDRYCVRPFVPPVVDLQANEVVLPLSFGSCSVCSNR